MWYLVVALFLAVVAEGVLVFHYHRKWTQETAISGAATDAALTFQRERNDLQEALLSQHVKEAENDRQIVLANPGAAASAERVRKLVAEARARAGSLQNR